MGDNLVHALGPEKTRKNQTSYAHAKSADIRNLFDPIHFLKFLRFQGRYRTNSKRYGYVLF